MMHENSFVLRQIHEIKLWSVLRSSQEKDSKHDWKVQTDSLRNYHLGFCLSLNVLERAVIRVTQHDLSLKEPYLLLLLKFRRASLQDQDLEDSWSVHHPSNDTTAIFDCNYHATICEGKKCLWFGQIITYMKNIFNFTTWFPTSSLIFRKYSTVLRCHL